MADSIKIGSLDISAFKVGSSDCKIYLGDTLLYSGGTPPTPTYQWVLYNEGDTVPSTTFYGVKLYIDLGWDGEIDFGIDGHTGIGFIYDASNNEWTAIDATSQNPIDINGYFDGASCYTILFSDLGYGGMLVDYPLVGEQFEFDVDLYEQI